jgi:hypothetical protein
MRWHTGHPAERVRPPVIVDQQGALGRRRWPLDGRLRLRLVIVKITYPATRLRLVIVKITYPATRLRLVVQVA